MPTPFGPGWTGSIQDFYTNLQNSMPGMNGNPQNVTIGGGGNSALMNALAPSMPQQNTQLPVSLSSPNAQLNQPQQNRISQAMGDMGRINAMASRVGGAQAASPAFSQLQQGFNTLGTNNAFNNLSQGMNFGNAMQGFQIDQSQQSSALLQQLLGPLMGAMMQQGGMGGMF